MASSELCRHLIWLPVSSRAPYGETSRKLPAKSLQCSGQFNGSLFGSCMVTQDNFLLDHPLPQQTSPSCGPQPHLSSEIGIPALRVSRTLSLSQSTHFSSQQCLPSAIPAPPGSSSLSVAMPAAIPQIPVNSSLLNFPCLRSCVVLVFCPHQGRFFVFQSSSALDILFVFGLPIMGLVCRNISGNKLFPLPRAGDMKEC